jgi:hypothetical protein
VENLFVPAMVAPSLSSKSKKKKLIGFSINNQLFFEDEVDVKKVHTTF